MTVKRQYRILFALALVLAVACSPACLAKWDGTLTIAIEGDPATFDLHRASGTSITLATLIFDYLVEYDAKGNRLPGLAESWDVSPDAATYTFKIRKGVTFHDGTKADAAAVKFNFDRQLDPAAGAARTKELAALIDSISTPDDYTVVFKLKKPDVTFIGYYIGDVTNGAIMSPASIKKWGPDVAVHPVGTGPFKFASYAPGQKVVLEANEDYWGGAPKARKLVISIVPDPATRLVELETGNVDFANKLDPSQIAAIKRNKNLLLHMAPSTSLYGLWFNLGSPAFKDVRVRKALSYALDKDRIVEALCGNAAVRSRGPVPVLNLGCKPTLKEIGYEVDEANKLLDAAGFVMGKDGVRAKEGQRLEFTILSPDGRYIQDKQICEAAQEQFARVGAKATVKVVESSSFYDEYLKGQFDIVFIGGWFTDPDPARGPMFLYLGETMYNKFNYKNAELLKLFDQMKGEASIEKRKELSWKCQDIIMNDVVAIWLYNANILAASSKGLKGYEHNGIGFLRFDKAWME